MKAYICGPMRGYDEFNFPAFYRAEGMLFDAGFEVVNPARHDNDNGFDETHTLYENAFDLAQAFRWDVEQLLECDAIYCLDGWEASRGAVVEHGLARMLGLKRWYETPPDYGRYEYSHVGAMERANV